MLLATLGTQAQTAKRYSPPEQQAVLKSAQVLARKSELDALRGDTGALLKFAADSVAAAAAAPLENEYLLNEWLLALRGLAPDATLREQVSKLTQYSAKALGPSPEPHHALDEWVPAFDVASQARGTLRAWELADHVAMIRQSLISGGAKALALADGEALAQVVATAPVVQLQSLRVQSSELPSQAATTLALRLQDAVLYRELFARPADEFVLTALADAAKTLSPEQARAVLREAAARPELASAATLAIAPLHPSTSDLLDCLGDAQRGGSCAQLLAEQADAATLAALGKRLEAGKDDLATRHALLALLWTEAPRGRAMLRDYTSNPGMPAALRQETKQWLR